MTKPRTPPLWLVLVPALVLAAVGVRAVTAEMNAAQDAARERATSVASRLARSVDVLVREYYDPLPRAAQEITRAQAIEATSHLDPRRAMTNHGFGLCIARAVPPDPDPPSAAEAALAEDALSTAERLTDEPPGQVAAAALTASVAQVIEHPVLRAQLLVASVELDPHAVSAKRAADLSEVVLHCPWVSQGRDGSALALDALQALTAAPRATDAAKAPLIDLVAEDPWGLDDGVRERALDAAIRSMSPGAAEKARGVRLAWDAARSQGRRLEGHGPGPGWTMVLAGDRATITVWNPTTLDGRETLLGGDIPQELAATRIRDEIAALRRESRVTAVMLVNDAGARAFANVVSPRLNMRDSVIGTAPLNLDGWHAEAVVYPEFGVPATAWILGAAVLVTTGLLVTGLLALRRSAERSARLAEDRQTFLDHVAHELRSPAAAVQALTEELASGHVTAEREGEYRRHLLRESRRLSSLVEDTLDLTRLEAGRLAFKMESADLRDVVRRAVEESNGAGRVVAKLPDEPVMRAVDEGTLRRAVKNLVENAVRHGGGDAPVTVTLEASNGAASIAVADRGRGIAAEHLPRLFERFYRVPSLTHETKGVGLGLALCREVARAHGGDVDVVSAPGKGSTFTMRIPLA